MIHYFLRAVGFSGIRKREDIRRLVNDVVQNADGVSRVTDEEEDVPYGVFYKQYAKGTGIAVCGSFDENGAFLYDYYVPYVTSEDITTSEEVSVERLSSHVAYEGLVDETRVGVSLIFYLRNMTDFMERAARGRSALKGAETSLSALSDGGTIIMPVMKTLQERRITRKKAVSRYRMIADAKKGNEEAMESLTLEDMDTYTAVSKKIHESDVFTLVDTYFMPFGVECDHYSVLGEILQCRAEENPYSKETIFVMKLLCNDLIFELAVNAADLTGEPKKGRRFKGNIWMQGAIRYPGSEKPRF